MTAFSFKNNGGETLASLQPTGKYGTAADMAGLVLFLCSPASSHVTGAHIVIDGGQLISRL